MNQEKPKHSVSVSDAVLLEKYVGGMVRDRDDDPGRIRRMKDNGFLSCTVDISTGEEFLRTTPSGEYEVALNNAPAREKLHRMIGTMLGAEGYW